MNRHKIATKFKQIHSHLTGKNIASTANVEIAQSAQVHQCQLLVDAGATLIIGEKCIIKGSKLQVAAGAKLIIGAGTAILNSILFARYPQASLQLGKHCYVGSGCRFYSDESIQIGDYNMIAYDCLVCDTQVHNLDWRIRRKALLKRNQSGTPGSEPKPRAVPLVIGDDCFLAKGCVIKVARRKYQQLTIGNRVVIGANAVVGIDIPDDYLAAGNPAQLKRAMSSEESHQITNNKLKFSF